MRKWIFGALTISALALPRSDEERLARHLSLAIQLPTISYDEPGLRQKEPIRKFHYLVQSLFPGVHRKLERKLMGESLLFHWKGTDPNSKPILLLSHFDVVPADKPTESLWVHPPFSGAISEGYVWGRGALDNKSGVIGILEAVESLLTEGFTPKRGVYLAFGHDEEIGGEAGALAIASTT